MSTAHRPTFIYRHNVSYCNNLILIENMGSQSMLSTGCPIMSTVILTGEAEGPHKSPVASSSSTLALIYPLSSDTSHTSDIPDLISLIRPCYNPVLYSSITPVISSLTALLQLSYPSSYMLSYAGPYAPILLSHLHMPLIPCASCP